MPTVRLFRTIEHKFFSLINSLSLRNLLFPDFLVMSNVFLLFTRTSVSYYYLKRVVIQALVISRKEIVIFIKLITMHYFFSVMMFLYAP